MISPWTFVSTLGLVCVLCACGDSTASPPPDLGFFDVVRVPDGDPLDGGTSDDFDGDGLCNNTEAERGSDPFRADSDNDGIPDGPEVALGFDPINSESPGRDSVQLLRESNGASLDVLIERDLFGNGQDLAGAFSATPIIDAAGEDARTFFRSASVSFASPSANYALIEDQIVRAVTGRVLVGYALRFEFGDASVRECVRAYPYTYTIKRSDGVIAGVETRVVVVVPPGGALSTSPWCPAQPSCR